ncbi:MAG: hypothetical protein ABL908_07190, partial [Hyphomicrobium sp.]
MTSRNDTRLKPVAAPQPFPPAGALFDFGLMLVALVLITISPLALVELGLNYDEAGGTALEKIHPGTMLASLLLLAAMTTQGN